MLEGIVARLLNQLLGKYVVDLDTENLNVGIFSGQVQMTDVRLKPEALYELELPIEVVIGTIGKIWLQIPWNRLWSQPVVINIENIHILAKPIVRFEKYDYEKDKRLLRAYKKRALGKLDIEGLNIGGPKSFAEHLVANIVNNMQISVTNVHIRYEDSVSLEYPMACGFCIGSISAEPTNSKWKACIIKESPNICYYLVKVEALFTYWDAKITPTDWNFPADYYTWRNSMARSLENFSFNGEEFDFVVKPTTLKTKIIINKSETGHITTINSDVVIHDCSVQISREQFTSINETYEALTRMLISWNYLNLRPIEPVSRNKRAWWRYACQALLEQRIRPYTWSRIKKVREHHKKYIDAYKVILMNPNDTELKLDLQKHEDNLTLLTAVIARQQAKHKVELFSLIDKSLWVLLPSPEKSVLCEKIGFSSNYSNKKDIAIEHKYQFRIGNLCVSLLNKKRIEILMATLTQFIVNFVPNLRDDTFILTFKLEGIVIEGANANEHLTPIIYSEHTPNSPAYFCKLDLEKKPSSHNCTFKLTCSLSTIEIIYDVFAIKELNNYLGKTCVTVASAMKKFLVQIPQVIGHKINNKVSDFWDINLNLKVPVFIIPEDGNVAGKSGILVLDLGKIDVTTELWKRNDVLEFATQMEIEEQLYSRLHINCTDIQILFGNCKDNWKESMKEKDTELHVLPKIKFTAFYALRVREVPNIPRYKVSCIFETFKVNIRERKLEGVLEFFNTLHKNQKEVVSVKVNRKWSKDKITIQNRRNYHTHVLSIIKRSSGMNKARLKDSSNSLIKTKRTREVPKQDMNEVWARTVDLPGLEDNISPNNTISNILRFSFNEFTVAVYQSSAATDKQYLILRLHDVTMDLAYMTYGPAYQVSVKSVTLTDKCHTTCSGQYLDLIHSPFPNKEDVFVLLYRKVDAKCPEFWSHFHGVETSLVADFDKLNVIFHQEAIETLLKYSKYLWYIIASKGTEWLFPTLKNNLDKIKKLYSGTKPNTPVPAGAVKYSQSGRLNMLHIKVCASDFDIMEMQISGLEVDLLFRANERFVFKSFLRHLSLDYLFEVTLYPKILSTDGDKVYEVKFVQNATRIAEHESNGNEDKIVTNGTFKLYLGRIHVTFLYKLVVQFQRFIAGMEMISYMERLLEVLSNNISKATDTLKPNSKIHLSINVQGPVILFPQKSDSPNVIIVDTGELSLENFFKRYSNDVIDNILVKLENMCLSRAVMGLTSNIEMQEAMLDPLGLSLDVKSYVCQTNSLKTDLSWEIDGNLDVIKINVGQRDLSILIACYTDNIGEGKLLNLLPERKASLVKEDDSLEAVKKLESFFCKPKQKDISLKISLDGLLMRLFFDPSELLSSPIRDLNHGFCKIELTEVALHVVVYTDKTLEGKFTAEIITIEELGPDVNTCNKFILRSAAEDSTNNNSKVTVNKPPVIDVTFTQNKSNDKSIDTIIGSLSLSLSVPFCEKIAIFVFESLPKDNHDLGIVNPGYVGDHPEHDQHLSSSTSLTVALRINKPEFIFVIESTSKKQKHFITRSEVLLDYSRHNNTLNLVLSLSGIYTVFYESGLNASEPYVVLKRCELELARNFCEDKGEKISLSVSPIQIHISERVVHSINDILHDIAEHFRVPEQTSRKSSRASKKVSQKSFELDDLWEQKKMPETQNEVTNIYVQTKPQVVKTHQVFLMSKTDFLVVFHLEETPVFMVKSSVEMTMYGWSYILNSTCQITMQANYFNEKFQEWEPFIDPVVMNECEYKPWEVMIKVFQDRAMGIMMCPDLRTQKETTKNQKRNMMESFSGDEESDEEMVYMEPATTFRNNQKRRITTSLSSLLQESDSENEEGSNDKLVSAISDLFTGDWNESEASSIEQSSSEEEENFEDDLATTKKGSLIELNQDSFERATYIVVDAKETLNITITPSLLKVIKDLSTSYFGKTLSMINNKSGINIVNEIGPNTKVEFYRRNSKDNDDEYVLIDTKTYESLDSYPSSPTREICDLPIKESFGDEFAKLDSDFCCSFEIAESFDFPIQTTSTIYESAQSHFLRIYVPEFLPMQTNCSKRSWEKIISLRSVSNQEMYHLVAKHSGGKIKTVTISSPLEIRNETCFAMSIFYEPAVLQQLNLETMGYVRNPFESTIRMAVLEPHELFHVPLFIAFHCKLFIQPAYAETYYVSDEGLCWRTLANELEIPYYIVCRPKDKSNQEVFSLKVELEKNVSMKNSYPQSIPNYVIRLIPPLVFQNYLPYALEIQNVDLKQHLKIEPAEVSSIYSVDMNNDQKFLLKVTLQGCSWTGAVNITKEFDEKVVTLTSERKTNIKQLFINVKANKGNNIVYVYVPYWIINKTGLPLELKVSATSAIFRINKGDITLLTFKSNMKRSLTVKVYDSKWSNDFGLDASGTTGLVVCKDVQRGKRYSFLLSISLSKTCPLLTKIVYFLPTFLVSNKTNKFLRFMEVNEKTDLWIDLPPNETKVFWPETSSMQMQVKYRDSTMMSQAFSITSRVITVLRMDKGSALTVQVGGGKIDPYYISFQRYQPGDAPVLIKNTCAEIYLKIQQADQSITHVLNPNHSLLFTWDEPAKSRQLIWNVYNNRGHGFFIDIDKNGIGEEKISRSINGRRFKNQQSSSTNDSSNEDSDSSESILKSPINKTRSKKCKIFWICYYDSTQRTLVFSQQNCAIQKIKDMHFVEMCHTEFLFSLSGLGISIYSQHNVRKELAYVSVSSSPATWEVNVGHKWKTLTLELASWIEDKYRLGYKKCQLKDFIHIDFEKMFMMKPFLAELRRSHNSAIYFQHRKSNINQQINLLLNFLQIDNKHSQSIILRPMPTGNLKNVMPFIELSAIFSFNKSYCIIKDLRANLQQFSFNIDNNFNIRVGELFTENLKLVENPLVCYREDIKEIRKPIESFLTKKYEEKIFIEYMKISDVTVQISLSNRPEETLKCIRFPFASILSYISPLQLLPFVPAQNIQHRISSYEANNVRISFQQLLEDLWQNYKCQFLQQFYVHVLGIQVLINPYAFPVIPPQNIRSLEALVPATQLNGYRCLLGHLNMSSAALEQMIANVFSNQMLNNIYRIERHGSYQKSYSVPSSVLENYRNFNIGVTLALEQLIIRNNRGMMYDGETFFKSTGKALLSLITRHPDEKSNSIIIATEALHRAALLNEPVQIQQRLTRYCNIYLGLKPFSGYESLGNYLAETIQNSRFAEDIYWAHAALNKASKSILLITLKHLIKINKCRVWGPWEVDWFLQLDDIMSVPKISDNSMLLNVKKEEYKFVNSTGVLEIEGNKDVLVWLKEKIEQAMLVSLEEKSWTINENK